MNGRPLLRAIVLSLATLIWVSPPIAVAAKPPAKAMGKPDKPDKPDKGDKGDNGGNANKPAKVTWSPKRVEMDDVAEDGTIVVQISADKEVLGVSFFASGSLRGLILLPDDTIDIPEGETVELELLLDQTPEEAGHTIGGTIQAMSAGKHLAQPLTFSLKRSSSDGTEGEGEEEGDELMDSDGKLPLSWLFEDEPLDGITIDLFDEMGLATIVLVPNRDLKNLGLWFTPSSSACITASFDPEAESLAEAIADESIVFDDDGNIEFVAAGVEVPVLLKLENPDGWTCGGGTLHARSVAGNSRSFPTILGVRVEKGEGVEDESESTEVVAPAAVVDAASFSEQPISASQIVSIFGLNLGSAEQAVFDLDGEGKIGTFLNGTMVLFDGYPAPLLSASAGQINAIVPAAVRGSDVELQVLHNDQQSALFPVPLGRPIPSLFTLSGTQAAAVNSDGTLNGKSRPAGRNSIVLLFGTGGGPTVRPLPDGAPADEAIRLSGDVRVFIGGVEADVMYAGTAPGMVGAVTQFNVRINSQTPRGTQPVSIVINGVESTANVTLEVR